MSILIHRQFTPEPKYPVYPPYHTGLYLEDYFHRYALHHGSFARKYIAVSWTTMYCDRHNCSPLQTWLDSLPQSDQYFTVCQHDDAPRQTLPPNTLVFSAGGNVMGPNIVPVPLVCSSLGVTQIETNRPVLASFVGSLTHPLRSELVKRFGTDKDFVFSASGWSPRVSSDKLGNFITTTQRSVFCLAPRGYGKSSFRMYEAFQLGAIPVYISDVHYLPWTDELDWSQFAVLIKPEQIPDLKRILLSYSPEQIAQMQTTAQQVYHKYFTLEGVCGQIHKRVNATT